MRERVGWWDADGHTTLRRSWLVAFVATLVSIGIQGFKYSISNNEFHIPLVLRSYELPQFAHDAFMQTLPRYTAPLFPLLSPFATEGRLPFLFFGLHALARFLTLYAVARLMRALGLGGVARAFGMALVILAPGLYGVTELGQQDLLPDYFTHSDIAQGLALLAAAGLVEGRIVLACVLSALAFDVNAFVGVWMGVPLAMVAWGGAAGRAARLRRLGVGAALGAAVALPVLVWVLRTLGAERIGFDYRAYLQDYFPFHFFIRAAKLADLVALAECGLAGVLALLLLGSRAGLVVFLGFGAVFLGGVVVGETASSALVLNLHLLRVDGLITLFAVAAAAAAAAREASRGGAGLAVGGVAAAGLLVNAWPLVVLGLLFGFLRHRRGVGAGWGGGVRPGVAAALAGLVLVADGMTLAALARAGPPPGTLPVLRRYYAGRWPVVPYWAEVKQWARGQTAETAVFLTPLRLDGFTTDALRVNWVDWKMGSAVMWAPSYYATWSERYAAVEGLQTPAAMIAYACAHGIDYVVIDRRVSPEVEGVAAAPVFSNAGFFVYAVRDCRAGARGPS